MKDALDGIPVDELADHTYGPSVAQQIARARELARVGPSTLVALSARACTDDLAEARSLLTAVYGLPKDRTTLALRQANRFATGARGRDVLGFIAGNRVSSQELDALFRLLPGHTAADGAACHRLCFASVEAAWLSGNPRSIGRAAATSRDVPSQLVAASMLASMRSAGDGFADKLAAAMLLPFSTGTGVRSVSIADRVFAAAYALDAKRPAGLDLGRASWADAPAGWRFRAAPWVLPILAPDRPTAVAELLSAVRARNLGFAGMGGQWLPQATEADIEIARNTAASAAPQLTKWFDRPMSIDLTTANGPQIILTQDDEYAYAWVGRNGRGVLVAFDTESFNGYALDEADSTYALAAAIGWYVDVSIALRRAPGGTSSVRRHASGSKVRGHDYIPTPNYIGQYQSVSTGTTSPPRPHMVAAFIRTLNARYTPNPRHIADAPQRLRQRMGPSDTYVRSHKRGGSGALVDWAKRLSQYSALADVLGVIEHRN